MIIRVKEVQADENCGFRAIANMLGFGKDRWTQARRDLLKEMYVYTQLYESVCGSAEHVEEIRHSLNHFEGRTSYDHWMVMPEM